MSIFAEFQLPASAFVLEETLAALPDLIVEFDRIVVDPDRLAPYIWVKTDDHTAFRDAVGTDSCVDQCLLIDQFSEESLYRMDWRAETSPMVEIVTSLEAVILEASAADSIWQVRIRFDSQEQATSFQQTCAERDISFQLQRFYTPSEPMSSGQYGLTGKQQETLVASWHAGYFDPGSGVTLADLAADLEVTSQSVSDRLNRGHHALIGNTLVMTPPDKV